MVLPTRSPSPPAVALACAMVIVCVGCNPAVIVFPYHARDFDHVEYEPWWVWQVASIDVR